jgi:hypothetical protein
LACRKLLARIIDGAFEDIINAAPTDSINMQSHAPKLILEGDMHFNPIIKYYRTFIYSQDIEFKMYLTFDEFFVLVTLTGISVY